MTDTTDPTPSKLGGIIGGGKTKAAKAAPTSKVTKAPAEKAAAKAKAPAAKEEGGVKTARQTSTLSKEGTQIDEHDGQQYPVTAFATVRKSDGSYVRGTVTRKNLPAWRAARAEARAATQAATDADKALKATAKANAAKQASDDAAAKKARKAAPAA